MRKLFILCVLFLLIGFSSCKDTPTTVTKGEELTTLALINIAKADTTCYHVIEFKNTLYVFNNEYVIIKKVDNLSGSYNTLKILIVLMLICIIIIVTWKDS